jgi:hypothetical protein
MVAFLLAASQKRSFDLLKFFGVGLVIRQIVKIVSLFAIEARPQMLTKTFQLVHCRSKLKVKRIYLRNLQGEL